MKRIIFIALIIAVAAYSQAAAQNHPKLIISNDELASIRSQLSSGENPPLSEIHRSIMSAADILLDKDPLVYKLDASGKRILNISRAAAQTISYCAYAYRYTGEKKYFDKAVATIWTVCEDFPDWNPKHYLDVCEMASGVGIGYDWLYQDLSPEMRTMIERKLKAYAFDTIDLPFHANIWASRSNWNQVCLGGSVCAALAVSDIYPEIAEDICRRAVESNREAVKYIYSPDGAYPEGPGYWSYGTCYQVWMNILLEENLGSDFGLSEIQGFKQTPWFEAFATGNTDNQFNFCDCRQPAIEHYPYWYFAYILNDVSLLYPELNYLYTHDYTDSQQRALIFMALKYASKIKASDIKPSPKHMYYANGVTPVVMCRTGWGKDDLWFATKGGKANSSHAHMDEGEFLYDAYGVRWSKDIFIDPYDVVESPLKARGGDYWAFDQNSMRWQVSRLNCRWHSCLIIDDKDFLVDGFSSLEETFESRKKLGAKFDLTPVYAGVDSVTRTVSIVRNKYLEVRDEIRSSQKHTVRFNLVSEAEPRIVRNGIILQKDGVSMKLRTKARGVRYKIWSTDPSGFNDFSFETPAKDTFICGFEADTESDVTFVTTLKKIR